MQSAITIVPQHTSETPRLKRRHTEVPTQPLTATARPKRIKSAKEESFLSSGLLSRVDAYSERSRLPSSGFIPQGSIQEGFLAHEPFSLFGQSGDTVPYNTATQQLAMKAADGDESNAVDEGGTDGNFLLARSSSVLLSTSQFFGSQQAPPIGEVVEGSEQVTEIEPGRDALPGIAAEEVPVESNDSRRSKLAKDTSVEESSSGSIHVISKKPEHVKDPSVVESSSTSIHVAPKTARTKNNTKSPAEELPSDPMSSQTALIGLPAEKYNPRPSRRRATQLPDEPITNPNKITRAKRSRTSDARIAAETVDPKPQDSINADIDETPDVVDTTAGSLSAGDTNEKQTHQESVEAAKIAESSDATNTRDELASTQSSINVATSTKGVTAGSFAQPAVPKRGKKGKKSQRSHTTIFEDHVDLTIKQQAPTLSQQQAERSAALLGMENAANRRKSQRGNRKPIDDQDELALDFVSPHKGIVAETSVNAPDAPITKLLEVPESSSSPARSAKTRGRGRKASPVIDAAEVTTAAQVTTAAPRSPVPSPDHDRHRDESPPVETSTEMRAEQVSKNIEPPKSSPTTHSPIKVVPGPTMRVGLSKRHRIPSLLKIVRPAKK